MKREKVCKIFCIILSIVIIAASFAGCSEKSNGSDDESKTTTTTTTTTTTENLETTFPETATQKVYEGLKKDSDGDYPYKLAEYTSTYAASNKTRTENLKVSADKINNICIPEEKVFSFNQTVGKRTVTAGYESAKVIKDGEFVDGLGGGVCQVSSTIFECVLRANVEIVARTNHTLEIGYVPLGGDATVQWNSKDFKFKNTLGTDLRLKMTCSGGKLTCSVWSKKKIDVGDVKIKITSSNGSYTLTRTVNGKQNYRTTSKYKKAK